MSLLFVSAGLLMLGAAPTGSTVRWVAPPQCPSAASVEASVIELLGDPDALVDRSFDVRVTKTGSRYRAQMIWTGDDGAIAQREFGDESCEAVAEAVGLYIAVAVDGDLAAPKPAQAQPATVGFALGVSATADYGTLPRTTAGLRPRVWLSYRAFAAAVHYETWLPQSNTSQTGEQGKVGVTVGGHVVGIAGCGVPRSGIVSFPICLGAEAGVLLADPTGLEQNQRQRRPWVAGSGSVSVRVRLGKWIALIAGPEVAIAVVRPRFTSIQSDGSDRVLHAPKPASVRGMLGFEFWGRS